MIPAKARRESSSRKEAPSIYRGLISRNTGAYGDARVGGQLFSRDDFGYSRFVISGQPTTRPVSSKPFWAPDHFDNENQGRNGTPGSVSKPDGFGD